MVPVDIATIGRGDYNAFLVQSGGPEQDDYGGPKFDYTGERMLVLEDYDWIDTSQCITIIS